MASSQRKRRGINSEQTKKLLSSNIYLIDPHMDFENKYVGGRKVADMKIDEVIEMLGRSPNLHISINSPHNSRPMRSEIDIVGMTRTFESLSSVQPINP